MSAQAIDPKVGHIKQVLGPVLDVEFPGGKLPAIYDAVRITNPAIDDRAGNLVAEVAQHLGENTVRCIAMDTPEGWVRERELGNPGEQIRAPGGAEALICSPVFTTSI